MAWDSESARRRQKSGSVSARTATSLPLHSRQLSKAATTPAAISGYVADPFLADFLAPSFDPVEYLDKVLPPLKPSPGLSSLAAAGSAGTTATTTRASKAAAAGAASSVADVSSEAQTVVSQLSAHTSRLTSTLTQLTDDMLRSGSRLAYEVELLRGKTLGLAEALSDTLRADMDQFVPGGVHLEEDGAPSRTAAAPSSTPAASAEADTASAIAADTTTSPPTAPADPTYITQLRTLVLVRSRLDAVIKTFGDAMAFVFPPSELSVSASFISVSAPEPGSASAAAGAAGEHGSSTEDKGQQVLRALRDDIATLLAGQGGAEDAVDGIERATRQIQALKDLCHVWRGTAEEKGRTKFVDSLAKMVEDRHRELLREMDAAGSRRDGAAAGGSSRLEQQQQQQQQQQRTGSVSGESGAGTENRAYATAYGLISQLQKIRSGL